jgi:hypothetical protein
VRVTIKVRDPLYAKPQFGDDAMILSAHQPAYLPWLGYFHKLTLGDTFCVFDTAPYRRRDFINRNRIKTDQGPLWLSVPVYSHGKPRICDVRIRESDWQRKHLLTVANAYAKAPYYDDYIGEIHHVLAKRYVFLADLTTALLRLFVQMFEITTRLVVASDYDFTGKKSDCIIDMCTKFGAATYVFGAKGRNYADIAAFASAGINVVFQEYKHPRYRQRFGAFVPNLSIIDLLFNEGPRSLEILLSGNERYTNIAKWPGESECRTSASGEIAF